MAADKAEKSSKMPDRRLTREDSPESSDGEVIVPATPPRPAQLAGESQGGNTITLALRTPERLRLGPDLAPRVTPPGETWRRHSVLRPRVAENVCERKMSAESVCPETNCRAAARANGACNWHAVWLCLYGSPG
jgi:hypothetical protein